MNKEPHHRAVSQRNRKYGDDVIAVIRDLHWNDGKQAPAIAHELSMSVNTVYNLMSEHAISERGKVYRAAKFDGWSFHHMNLEGLRS